MFEFAGLAVRNPSWVTKNARKAYAVSKAMKAYRLEHPACEWCGRAKRVQIHHVVPVSVSTDLAAEPDNLITFCAKRCHITVGHSGNYKNFVNNVRILCITALVIKTKAADDPTVL